MKIEILYYITLGVLLIGQLINVYGSFVTANNTKDSLLTTYIATLPYMVIQKLLTTVGIYIIDSYHYVTTNNIVLTLLIFQFVCTIFVSYIYLNIPIYTSDYIACILFYLGYYISTYKAYTGNVLQ
jgi:hypothetical protein